MEDFIFYFINGILISFILSVLNKQSKKEINITQNETFVFRMNKFYLYFGWLLLLLLLLLGFILAFVSENNESDLVFKILLLLLFGGSGLYIVIFYLNHRVTIDATKIEVYNFKGKSKSILWTDLQSGKFRLIKGMLDLENQQGNVLSIHQHIIVFKTIIQQIERHSTVTFNNRKLPF
jgi:hypothetical protein